jgi:hypothetical protein
MAPLTSACMPNTDVGNSVRNFSKADMFESQRNWQRHLNLNFYITESFKLCHHYTVPRRGFPIADQWWDYCGDWSCVYGAAIIEFFRLPIEERRSGICEVEFRSCT